MRTWAYRHPILTNLVLIVLVVAPGYWRLEQQAAQACEDRRESKLLLRDLVELSDDDVGGFNLTAIPSFNDLDPETQQYLTDLESASKQAPRPSEFKRNALKLLDIPEC